MTYIAKIANELKHPKRRDGNGGRRGRRAGGHLQLPQLAHEQRGGLAD